MHSLVGPPGSGKSTQIALLEESGWVSVSAGGLLRDQAPPEILKQMDLGLLVDQAYTNSLMEAEFNRLSQADPEARIVIDGFPRTVDQARWLLEVYGASLEACWSLQADDDFLIGNLLARGRSDDRAESIRQRIAIYKKNLPALINYYKLKGVPVFFIDAQQDLDKVQADIRQVLSHGQPT